MKILSFYSGTIFKCEYWTCDFAHVLLQKEEYHKINETYKYADSTESIKCPDCESYFYLDEAFAMHVRKIINIHILVIIVRDISLVMTICSRQAMPSSMWWWPWLLLQIVVLYDCGILWLNWIFINFEGAQWCSTLGSKPGLVCFDTVIVTYGSSVLLPCMAT